MPEQADSAGQTGALFPDFAPSPGRRSTNLREAAALFEVAAEATTSDDGPAQARDLQTGDLFAWGARQEQVRLRGSPAGGNPRPVAGRPFTHGPSATDLATRRPGLARCLDGSARGVGTLGRDRRVSRNRLLFALLLFGVLVYVVLHLALGR